MKKLVTLVLAAALVCTLALTASAAPVTLTLSHQMPDSHSLNALALEFAEDVKAASNGEIVIDVFPAATLGTETENLQALTNGTLDIAIIAVEFYANYVDEAGILCLPFLYESYDDAYAKIEGEGGQKIRQLVLDKTNVRILGYYIQGFREIFTANKPVYTADDLAGLIIRIPDSTTYRTTFTQLGASPTPTAWGEVYTALDTGVVAAMENTPETFMAASLQEVCKYVNVTNHILGPTTFSMSEAVYQKLTPEQQQILADCAQAASEKYLNVIKSGSDANFNKLVDAGLTVVDTDTASMRAKIDYNAFKCTQSEDGQEIIAMMVE